MQDIHSAKLSSEDLVLGIDTGGTYTDGVLLEYHSRRVLASHKSLTTKRDYSIGIERVIENIHIENPASVKLVSISTTLATNAIAEGKGKRVALLLIGYDPELIASFKLAERFATPHYFFIDGGHDLYGNEQRPLDIQAIRDRVAQIKDQVEAIAISSYFSPLNPEHEQQAGLEIAAICQLPTVMGHQLSTKLGSVERATTAALNASLLAILQEFILAVRKSLKLRRIEAPLMVVRGDGTLMSDDFAIKSPVETIHSGPAASAIGGRFISRLDYALVVDIGGTTTDIALIHNGQVEIGEEGARVGNYKTAVKAANLLSFGLGGDSQILIGREKEVRVGPERVTPLAYLAHQYPQVHENIKALTKRSWTQATPDWLEHWYLLRDPQHDKLLNTSREKALVDYLRGGPQPLAEILKHLNLLHVGQLGAGELLRREIIGKSGLTPTDLLHIDGRYRIWDAEASEMAFKVFAQNQLKDRVKLVDEIWSQMTEDIIRAIITFLTERKFNDSRLLNGDMGEWFFDNSLYDRHSHLGTEIRLRCPIIGIGAPASVFLPDVAKKLHADLVLPDYHQVANAIGAVAGSVMVECEGLVYPKLSAAGLDVIAYYVQSNNGRYEYEDLDEAMQALREQIYENALQAAINSGADNPQVRMEEISDGIDTYRVRARATGNPRLKKETETSNTRP
jgi:N-methylhydantoinase A/oxoprolinase/acetone carboxylase beta subunit